MEAAVAAPAAEAAAALPALATGQAAPGAWPLSLERSRWQQVMRMDGELTRRGGEAAASSLQLARLPRSDGAPKMAPTRRCADYGGLRPLWTFFANALCTCWADNATWRRSPTSLPC